MNLYSIALFFHVVGALGFFVALGLEWFNLAQLRRTTTIEQVSEWFKTTHQLRGIAGISMLIILVAGFYMTFAAWGGAMWVNVAFLAMIAQGIVAGVLTSPRLRAIEKAIAPDTNTIASGPITPTLQGLIDHPLLSISMLTRVGMALGIVFLMCVKPALMGSVITIVVATVAGLALAMFMMGNRRGQTVTA